MTDSGDRSEICIDDEMKKSYLDYAMSVIIGRALPDVRDGLKPVHRRVLYAMRELRNDWNKPYKKSARIVGDVIGKYHPHGDTAVYDTIVRMAQDFSMRYVLINGQGNFGSIDGDPPAAMRYTEVRMMQMSHKLLEDLEKETVDFIPNYDESMTEPSVLPAKIPNLLINGSSGIAVGMATNIPPHNLSEVVSGICALIDNPEISFEELISIIPGPDFPTCGQIYGVNGIISAYKTGRGIIKIRGKVIIEKDKRTNAESIIISEIPYQVNKARMVEKIAELVRDKHIEGVKFVRDESDRQGMRVVVGLKRDQFAQVIVNQLYKQTQLENSFGIILLAVVDNRPELLTLKEVLDHFINFRRDIIIRRTLFELKKAQARAHILEGLKKALDHIDEIIALIRSANSPQDAKNQLIEKYHLSDIQSQAILDMKLQRLTGLERQKIIDEYEAILNDIKLFKEILRSRERIDQIVKEELREIDNDFGDSRRTKIVESTAEITLEDMIVEEDMVVTISKSGYIKRTPITLYESQKRGGKGKTAMSTGDEDFVEHLFVASTHHTFLFFTSLGRVYWSKVYDLPKAGRASKGKAIVNLLNFVKGEKFTTVLAVKSFEPDHYIFMSTKKGIVKKTDLIAYSRPRSNGIIALTLSEGDELNSVRMTDGAMDVFLCSAFGKSIRFKEEGIRATGRVSQGVIGMRLAKGDEIVGMQVLSHGKTLLVATENGFGKRTSIAEYPLQKRGGKGVITVKTNERNGRVVAILLVEDDDDFMLITDGGKIIRISVSGISVISRNTLGVKLINLKKDEKVTGASRVVEKEE